MSFVFRRIFAVAAACTVAIVIVRLLEQLAQQVTMPTGLDPTNAAQVKLALERGEFPAASLVLVGGGWLLAAYLGSRIALRLGHARVVAVVFTVIFTAVIIRDLTLLPHPTWMWLAGALGVPLVALGAAGESITVPGL